jgi:signal transduction histidine kinase
VPSLHPSAGSLERRLPVLIGGLVAVSVLATLLIVRAELRGNAVDTAGDRLARVAAQLAELGSRSSAQRAEAMTRAAAAPAVAGLAAGQTRDSAAAAAVLDQLRLRTDSTLPVQLRAADGRLLARSGGAPGIVPGVAGAAEVEPGMPVREGSAPDRSVMTYSAFDVSTERPTFWATVPVTAGTRLAGYLDQQRTLAAPALTDQLERLLGGELRIVFIHAAGGPWVSLEGGAVAVGAVPVINEPFERDAGGRWLAFATPVPGTAWLVLAEMPRHAVLARADLAMRRLLAVGGLLLLAGMLGAWLVSRRVTAPLRRLAAAADAIAAGDYSRRTGIVRSDEIGQLASSFDSMAEYVDRTHAEMAYRRSEAQAASAAKSEFLATMSHEIRTPVNAMIGYADLLDLGVPDPLTDTQRGHVARIRSSGEHLVGLVNDVLDFAKIESGSMDVERDVHAAADAIDAAVRIMQARATVRRVEISTHCPPDEHFTGDAHRLQQILLNLLGNALKFSPEGGAVEVRCDPRPPDWTAPAAAVARREPARETEGDAGWTCITVIDRGPGIPAEQHERIFEPFVQGTSGYTRSHGGTGLGLAISRRLARMMGGEVTVESDAGAGARFTVWLPRAGSAVPAGR